METTLYYFSATGNSLHFARKLASKLKPCKLCSMADAIQKSTVSSSSQRIGLVFPVYAWGAPRIVMDFIEKLNLSDTAYIFAVATCMGIPAKTLPSVQKALKKKGSDLNAGFVIQAECSSLMKKNMLDKIVIGLDQKRKRLQTGEKRINEIVSTIQTQKKHKPETSSPTANMFGILFHSYGINFFKTASGDFQVSDDCRGCGTCVRVCPRGNIVLKEGRPLFSKDCEMCHACVQWCPGFAITHPSFQPGAPQYQHSEIKAKDLFVGQPSTFPAGC